MCPFNNLKVKRNCFSFLHSLYKRYSKVENMFVSHFIEKRENILRVISMQIMRYNFQLLRSIETNVLSNSMYSMNFILLKVVGYT